MKHLFIQGIDDIIMHMPINLKQNQTGVASLLTVLFVSIILSIIVLGFIRVAIDEQRQAADDDLSTRAFYAAEAGIEDAKRAVLEELSDFSNSFALNDTVCAPPAGYNPVISTESEFDVEYSCMLVDMTPPDFQTYLEENESVVIHLQPTVTTDFNRIRIYWHLNETVANGGDGVGGVSVNHRPASSTLPQTSAWGYPAMLRTYLFSFDSNITRPELNNDTTLAFLNPVGPSGVPNPSSSGPPTAPLINHNPTSGTADPNNEGLVDAHCNDSWTAAVNNTEYLCFADVQLNSSDTYNHNVRLTSLYGSTHIKVIMYTGSPSNSADFVAGQQVLVDVTGRASDVFRRVEARLDLESGLDDLIPDFAIFSAEDLCKDFSVTDTTYTDRCTP